MDIDQQIEVYDSIIKRKNEEADYLYNKLSDITEIVDQISDKRNLAYKEKFKNISNDTILQDKDLLFLLFKEEYTNYLLQEKLASIVNPSVDELRLAGIDMRDSYIDDCLPNLSIELRKDQNISHVEHALTEWAGKWALGRPDLNIFINTRFYISESTILQFSIEDNFARIWKDEITLKEGSLSDCLVYISKLMWYTES